MKSPRSPPPSAGGTKSGESPPTYASAVQSSAAVSSAAVSSAAATVGVPSVSQCQDEVELRMALAQSQDKVSELVSLNSQMQREINKLKDTVSSALHRCSSSTHTRNNHLFSYCMLRLYSLLCTTRSVDD